MKSFPMTSKSDRDGFSLVEVMVSIVIMMVGLLGLLQSTNMALEHNLRNHLREQAVILGESQMNWFRNHSSTAPFSTLRTKVLMRGVNRYFDVSRTSLQVSDVSRKLEVNVAWSFKNISAQHKVISLITRTN